MKNILLSFFVLISLTITSQNNRGSASLSDGFTIGKSENKGHQFLLDNWVPGNAVDNNGNLSEKKMLNYDIYSHSLTFKDGSDNIIVIDTDLYSGFILTDKNKKDYLFSKIEGKQFIKEKVETKFYQLISVPSKKVILETIKLLKDPNASGWVSSSSNTKSSEFVAKEKYYVLGKDDKYIKVNLSKSSIIKAFKDQKKVLSAFIKEKNITIDKPEDLVAIVEYYHTL